ncbi:hypothetical protein [Providencia sneebia]|uniref:Uncharacterized protein n=1 Tax=Providencia sneebia DSM 19967 TaxID=1141660 RepID=K8WRD1_9GAMM|nr:hypothetical protein [Providencia sneebia]EKT59982.1 hypothetical protein OO7_04089 [Providencia sneebia DSM 19967]
MSKISLSDKVNIYFRNNILNHNVSSKTVKGLLKKVKSINDNNIKYGKNDKIPMLIVNALVRKKNLSLSKKIYSINVDSEYLKLQEKMDLICVINNELNRHQYNRKEKIVISPNTGVKKFNDINVKNVSPCLTTNRDNLLKITSNTSSENIEKNEIKEIKKKVPLTLEDFVPGKFEDSYGYIILDKEDFIKEIQRISTINTKNEHVVKNEKKHALFKINQRGLPNKNTKIFNLINSINIQSEGNLKLTGR